MDNEFKTIELWKWFWWDLDKDTQHFGSIDVEWEGYRVEKRYIQLAYGKRVHAIDDGELEVMPSRWEAPIAYSGGIRCKVCGKIWGEE